MKELDTAKLLSAAVKLSETRSTELLHKLRIELLSKLDNIQLVEGPSGQQGIKGLKGDQGDRGFIGSTGARGERGIQGEQGIQGEHGAQGIQGEHGAQGIQGDQGLKGDKGDQGLKGDKGDRGEQGLKGDKGDTGSIGPQGKQGSRGDKGEHGDIGPTGLTGLTGPQGIQGEPGAPGSQGLRGQDGMPGAIGPSGKTGDTGPKGPEGPKGTKGTKGDDADIKPLQKKFDDLAKSIENKISRIAYSVTAAGASTGSGEVNLYALDDVDYTSVKNPTDGHALLYDSTVGKWTSGPSGGSITIREDGATIGTTVTSLNFVGATVTASGNSTVVTINSNPDAYYIGNTIARNLINDRLQVANAAAIYQTKAIERAALANTNASIANAKTNLTGTNTALRTLIADRLQVANAATIYQTKATERAALANTNASIATQTSRITLVNTNLTSTNTALRTLITDRLQVANAAAIYATKINPTTSGLLEHTGRGTISTNLTVSGNTTTNKATVTSSLTSSGNTTLSAGLSANGSFGTPNYVLKTNGAGVFWAAVGASGSDASKLAVANSFVKLTSYSSNTHGITQLANNVISTTALTTNPAGHIALILPNNTTIKIPYWV